MSSYLLRSIGSLVDAGIADIQTGPFGTQLAASDYVESGVPVINVRNIGLGSLKAAQLEYVNDVVTDRLPQHLLQPNDIVLGRKGAVERHVLIREPQAGWMQGSDCIRLRLDRDVIDPRYFSYHCLSSRHKQWMLTQGSHGTTMATLNQKIIRRIELPIPPLPIQHRIADILSAYDDLTENNNRRMALLEEAIHLLYREWFVYMRFPGHERVKVGDGVPEGWEHALLGDICTVNGESIKKKSAPPKINYVDIASVTTGRVNAIQLLEFDKAPSRARRMVRDGDIIWATVRPGNRAYALILDPLENLVASTGFAVLTPSFVPSSFLYCATTTDWFVAHMKAIAGGAAYPAVKPQDFEAYELVVPPKRLLTAFDEFARPSLLQMRLFEEQNQRLREARDLLLPRLMNGSIAA